MKNIYHTLRHSTRTLFLLGSFGIIAFFILGSDYVEYLQLSQNEKMLQKLQIEKEKILTKKMEKPPEQREVNQLVLLNRSSAGFTLANLCDISKTLLTKIQLEKSRKKMTENTFSVSLDLISDYAAFLTLIEKLAELSWKIRWETVKITSKNSQKTKINSQYPLQIKIKLAIENYYLPNKKTPEKLHEKTSINLKDSPFLMKRYAGKLIYNQQSFDIIDTGHARLKAVKR